MGGNNGFPLSHPREACWGIVLSNAAHAECIVDTAQPKDGSLEAASEMVHELLGYDLGERCSSYHYIVAQVDGFQSTGAVKRVCVVNKNTAGRPRV